MNYTLPLLKKRENMPQFIEQLGQQVGTAGATSLLGAGMGLLMQGQQDRRQINQQRRLQNLQIVGQKDMTDYNYSKQLQMWKDTNYPAQMEQLKLAGLNPGLIYGMGGAGGATTGGGGGTVQGGHAPTGGGEIAMGIQTAAQLALLDAQRRNIEADTKNKEADIPVKEATVPKLKAETGSLLQGVEESKARELLTKAQTKIARLEALFKSETMEDAIDIVNSQRAKWVTDIDIALTQLGVDRATAIQKAELLKNQVQEVISRTALNKAQEAATKAGVEQHWTEISQGWQKLMLENKGLDIRQQETNIKAFEAAMKAKYPGAWNVIGRILNEAANGIGAIWGEKPATEQNPKEGGK